MIAKEEKFSSSCIQHVTEKLDANGVKWWIDHGSLLGIVRDNQLLPWDRDVDFGALCDDLDIINKIRENLACAYEHVSFNPLTNAISVRLYDVQHSLYWTIDIAFYTKLGEMAIKHYVDTEKRFGRAMGRFLTVLSGDLAPVSNKKLVNWMMLVIKKINNIIPYRITVWAASRVARLTPKLVNEVEFYYFKETQRKLTPYGVLCFPDHAEKYLERRYGPDWLTPKKEWNFLVDDRCIRSGLK